MSKLSTIKKSILTNIERDTNLEEASNKADNQGMRFYHRGRKEVWLDVFTELENMLPGEELL